MSNYTKVFSTEYPNRSTALAGGLSSGILCWDDIRNPLYKELWDSLVENFWISSEVSMIQDANHWHTRMSPVEKEVYKLSLGQVAAMDAPATRYKFALSQYVSDPAAQAIFSNIGFMESVHNESYTYMLSSFLKYGEMLEVFELPKTIPLMVKRNKLVMDLYDEFISDPNKYTMLRSLTADLVLEGLFFINAFTYFHHLARNNKMIGSQTIITLIQRDENVHAYTSSIYIKDILKENPDIDIDSYKEFVYNLFRQAVLDEIEWGDYLYANIPQLDLADIRKYTEYRANVLLQMLGLEQIFTTKQNPMPWITVFDPANANSIKTDFFEGRVTNYQKTNQVKNAFDDL